MVQGTDHFRTSVEEGLAVVQGLRGHTSGMAVPAYVIDAPGGGGKIPLLPDYLQSLGTEVVLKNYLGDTYRYPNPPSRVEETKVKIINE
jgi:lysine 2,3-aminomutase